VGEALEAIDESVRTRFINAALFERVASHGDAGYANQIQFAMRR
jgi:6-phosphogluconate dehydrogenase